MKNTFISHDFNTNISNTSLALGFFDGIHKGHQKVLSNTLEFAEKLGTKSTVLTFRNHPVEILYNVIPEFITTPDERIDEFRAMGFDNVIMADFTMDIANLKAQDYFNDIIMKFNPKSISVGYNHRFGAKQSGDIDFLNKMSTKYNFILNVASPVKQKNEVTSSTLIRNYIRDGEVEKSNILLGKPYKVKNIVVAGSKRGRTINFPTANIQFPENKIIPRFGVYAGNAIINNNKYKAIANVGLHPTFGNLQKPLIEIHILNFDKYIYGEYICFEFLNFIRPEQKFNSTEQLIEQINKDILKIK